LELLTSVQVAYRANVVRKFVRDGGPNRTSETGLILGRYCFERLNTLHFFAFKQRSSPACRTPSHSVQSWKTLSGNDYLVGCGKPRRFSTMMPEKSMMAYATDVVFCLEVVAQLGRSGGSAGLPQTCFWTCSSLISFLLDDLPRLTLLPDSLACPRQLQ
jgi:hypothetical protein